MRYTVRSHSPFPRLSAGERCLVFIYCLRPWTGGSGRGTVLAVSKQHREKLGFDPNEQQCAVLRGGKRGILKCTRQWGKSTVAAAKAAHRAYTEAGSLTLLL